MERRTAGLQVDHLRWLVVEVGSEEGIWAQHKHSHRLSIVHCHDGMFVEEKASAAVLLLEVHYEEIRDPAGGFLTVVTRLVGEVFEVAYADCCSHWAMHAPVFVVEQVVAIDHVVRIDLHIHFHHIGSATHPTLSVLDGTGPGGVAVLEQARGWNVQGSCVGGCACGLARRSLAEVCGSSFGRKVVVDVEEVGDVVGRGGSTAGCHHCGRHSMGDSWKRMWA